MGDRAGSSPVIRSLKEIPYLREGAYLWDFSLLTECNFLRNCVIILHVTPYFATRCNTKCNTDFQGHVARRKDNPPASFRTIPAPGCYALRRRLPERQTVAVSPLPEPASIHPQWMRSRFQYRLRPARQPYGPNSPGTP